MNGVFLRLMAELDAIGEFAVSANFRQSVSENMTPVKVGSITVNRH